MNFGPSSNLGFYIFLIKSPLPFPINNRISKSVSLGWIGRKTVGSERTDGPSRLYTQQIFPKIAQLSRTSKIANQKLVGKVTTEYYNLY